VYHCTIYAKNIIEIFIFASSDRKTVDNRFNAGVEKRVGTDVPGSDAGGYR